MQQEQVAREARLHIVRGERVACGGVIVEDGSYPSGNKTGARSSKAKSAQFSRVVRSSWWASITIAADGGDLLGRVFPAEAGFRGNQVSKLFLTKRKNLRGLEQGLLALIAGEFGFKCLSLLRRQHARVRDVRWKLFRPVCWHRGCRRQYVLRYQRGCPQFASPRAELPEAAYSLNTPAHTRRLPDAVKSSGSSAEYDRTKSRAAMLSSDPAISDVKVRTKHANITPTV
jgi:hypothetical protein